MSIPPEVPPPPGDYIGEVRDGHRWTGSQWIPISREIDDDEDDKRKALTALIVVIGLILLGLVAWWIYSAVEDDDNGDEDSNPTPSASEEVTASEEEIALTCPPPIGNVTVTTDPEDMWAPGYVVGSDVVLDPIAFGVITFTNTETGEKFTESAVTKTGADTTGAIECSFTETVEDETDENGEPVNGTVDGTVIVVPRP